MKITIPQPVLDIYQQLKTSGFDVYLVGGSVRNILLNKPVKDWDMTTNATPEEIIKLFPDAFYDNQFGTVGLPAVALAKEGVPPYPGMVEITTFRSESGYSDRRHPETVTW